MIKRYAKDGHELVEWSDGNWVKYDDIAHLLKEKTLEQHRAEFEGLVSNDVMIIKRRDGTYVSHAAKLAWQAWKAARGVTE